MTTFSGQYGFSQSLFDVPFVAPNFTGLHSEDTPRKGLLAFGVSAGSWADVMPDALDVAYSGSRNNYTFFDDFYLRIYLFPSYIDFQAIASDTSRPMVVWNAFFEPINLTSFLSNALPGISLTLPTALPVHFSPLQLRTFYFNAPQEGEPDIQGSYTFSFDIGGSPVVPVSGARAKLWPFSINWKNDYTISHEFKTEVITSRAKREQRIAQRQTPRKNLEFSFLAKDANFRRLNQTMVEWAGRIFIVPDPSKFVTSTATLSAFDNMLLVDEVPTWAVEGVVAVLSYKDTLEVRNIQGVAGSTVIMANVGATVFPAGTKLHYAYPSQLSQDLNSRRHTNTVTTANVRFRVLPGNEKLLPLPVAPITFQGREVWLHKFNWADDVSVEYQHFREEIDYGRGRITSFYPVEFNSRMIKGTFLARDKHEADDIENFFRRCRGQQIDFYRPTFEDDILQRAPAVSGSIFLRSPGTELFDSYRYDPYNKMVFVYFNDGTYEMNKVVEIQTISDVIGNDTQLEMQTPWSRTLDDVAFISWMPLCRNSTDTLTVVWLTDAVCNITMALQYTPHYAAESLP